MPFTVHSGKIATTALGTVFSVDGQRSLFTAVHLYSGRIVIKKEERTDTASFKDIYLQPGQELTFNNANFAVVMTRAEARGVAKRPVPVKHAQPQIFTFTKQSVPDILAVLQQACKVTITYDSAALKNIDFTGSYNKDGESLDTFLATLCSLNELNFTKTGPNTFSIEKK